MRMEVVTHDKMISLGFLAKNLFVKHVLVVDEDGQSFDTLQTVQADTLEKIKAMPTEGGFTQEIKDGAICAFSSMNVGDKFLCLDAWVTNYQSEEAKFYWEVQRLCNEGHALQDASKLANQWIKEQRKESPIKKENKDV